MMMLMTKVTVDNYYEASLLGSYTSKFHPFAYNSYLRRCRFCLVYISHGSQIKLNILPLFLLLYPPSLLHQLSVSVSVSLSNYLLFSCISFVVHLSISFTLSLHLSLPLSLHRSIYLSFSLFVYISLPF